MAKFTDNTKCKRCRRAGEKLSLKGERCSTAKCAMVKRNFPPGVHGSNKRPGKLTNYGRQLLEKQKARRIYGVAEKQFRNYFEKALKKIGNTGELLFRFLESRLDITVYRLGLAPSVRQARQLVSHGHFAVNGKKVNIPSYQVKAGDVVSVREKAASNKYFSELAEKLSKKTDLAPWLVLEKGKLAGKVTGIAKLGDLPMNVDWRTIVEFYSK
jgi:small subunit ribosomal protein S4